MTVFLFASGVAAREPFSFCCKVLTTISPMNKRVVTKGRNCFCPTGTKCGEPLERRLQPNPRGLRPVQQRDEAGNPFVAVTAQRLIEQRTLVLERVVKAALANSERIHEIRRCGRAVSLTPEQIHRTRNRDV